MTRISISEAARRWKKSRGTIQKLVRLGKLEVMHTGSAKTLGIAELVQVLGEPESAQEGNRVQADKSGDERLIQRLIDENNHLRTQNEKLLDQIGKRDQFEQNLLTHQKEPPPPKDISIKSFFKRVFG